jgi:hypothetical protein
VLTSVSAPGGRWSPGIGDPTVLDWVTVAAYLTVAVLCWWWAGALRHGAGGAGQARRIVYSRGLALLMLIRGLNKQLDLRSWMRRSNRMGRRGKP